MRPIRFRCPRCRMHHSASVSRAGQRFACSGCFAPMNIPEASVVASAEIPTALLLEVPPPAPEIVEPVPQVAEAPRPRRKRPETRPAPTIDLTAPPEFKGFSFPPEPIQPSLVPEPEPFPFVPEPEPLRRSKVVGPAMPASDDSPAESPEVLTSASVGTRRAARGRFAVVALASVLSVALIVVGSRAISDTGPVESPPTVEAAAPVAIAEAAPVPEPSKLDPPAVPAPAPVPAPSSVPPVDPTTTAPPVAANPVPSSPPAGPLTIRRRQNLGQEALRSQLADLPELTISHDTENMVLAAHGLQPIPHQAHHGHPQQRGGVAQAGFLAPAFGGRSARPPAIDGEGGMHIAHLRDDSASSINLIKRKQPDLSHLPWRMGDECHLDRESAEELEVRSRVLRDQLQAAIPAGDTRPDSEILRALLLPDPNAPSPVVVRFRSVRGGVGAGAPPSRSDVTAAIPALMQLLMAERTPAREVLVDVLSRIKGEAASKALARLAIFDLAPEVRERALTALRERPTDEYRSSLLDGFRYPWAPVADHSAEALVALEDRESVPELVRLLDEPDPAHPRTEIRNGQKIVTTRSVVQVNHLRNCLLCHAPSSKPTTDLVRGRVPTEGAPLPPPQQYYADRSPGEFVRAEVTYLKQDFSVAQPVDDSGPWPGYQRYDYLVVERPVPSAHTAHPKAKAKAREPEWSIYPQRESVLFALRNLTGEDHGDSSDSWKDATRPK